jgi:pimeloyl-ACP methyl ester carboxylesterase
MIALAMLVALEVHPGIQVDYGFVTSRGLKLRTITTAPPGNSLPGIFVVGWLSCDSVEFKREDLHGVDRLLREVVRKSGALVMRMDKPGVGDSEGNCARTDFETELAGYRAAFAAFLRDPRLDKSNLAIIGISNGAGFAPLVAQDTKVSAYVSIGGWVKTWFEHMVSLERRRLALSGASGSFDKLVAFHFHYLFERLTPARVEQRYPPLRGVWYDEPDSQYGRPASFYQQLQSLDLIAAWRKVHARTLVVWGEYDWIMDRSDQELLQDLTGGKLLIVPQADHVMSTHPDPRAAFEHMGEGGWPDAAMSEVLAFLVERKG